MIPLVMPTAIAVRIWRGRRQVASEIIATSPRPEAEADTRPQRFVAMATPSGARRRNGIRPKEAMPTARSIHSRRVSTPHSALATGTKTRAEKATAAAKRAASPRAVRGGGSAVEPGARSTGSD
ncbi:MAG: hypothetical protein NVS3B1_25410 [Marmoricola sp.]